MSSQLNWYKTIVYPILNSWRHHWLKWIAYMFDTDTCMSSRTYWSTQVMSLMCFEFQKDNIYGLVQERANSNASAMELRLSCTNPSTWYNDMFLTWCSSMSTSATCVYPALKASISGVLPQLSCWSTGYLAFCNNSCTTGTWPCKAGMQSNNHSLYM